MFIQLNGIIPIKFPLLQIKEPFITANQTLLKISIWEIFSTGVV